MSRRKGREQAFIFLFQSLFTNEGIDQIIESSKIAEDIEVSEFAVQLFNGVKKRNGEIDQYIRRNIKGWKIERLSKTAITILRIAVYEMIYETNIPNAASINEAVELAKKYGDKEEFSYVNGVLGSVNKEITNQMSDKVDA